MDYNKALEVIQANKIFGADSKDAAWLILALQCWYKLDPKQREEVYQDLINQIGK